MHNFSNKIRAKPPEPITKTWIKKFGKNIWKLHHQNTQKSTWKKLYYLTTLIIWICFEYVNYYFWICLDRITNPKQNLFNFDFDNWGCCFFFVLNSRPYQALQTLLSRSLTKHFCLQYMGYKTRVSYLWWRAEATAFYHHSPTKTQKIPFFKKNNKILFIGYNIYWIVKTTGQLPKVKPKHDHITTPETKQNFAKKPKNLEKFYI